VLASARGSPATRRSDRYEFNHAAATGNAGIVLGERLLMQYARLEKQFVGGTGPDGTPTVTLCRELFQTIVAAALRGAGQFDEAFYLANYPDLREALAKGKIASGADHYYANGYWEKRLPRKIAVDEMFYLQQNPDIAGALRRRLLQSAQQHFDTAGFTEGRLPFKTFSLF
jgi:hypothetical protein